MRRPRVRLWMMLLAIAMIGGVLGVRLAIDRWQERERLRAQYCRDADMYERAEAGYAEIEREIWQKWHKSDLFPVFKETVDDAHSLAEHARSLASKYRWAAAHPWEPVEDDPPEPGRTQGFDSPPPPVTYPDDLTDPVNPTPPLPPESHS